MSVYVQQLAFCEVLCTLHTWYWGPQNLNAETIQIKTSITKQELCLYLQTAYWNLCKLGTCCVRVLNVYNITL